MRNFDNWHDWTTAREQAATYLPSATLSTLDEAVTFAQWHHSEQTRPAGEPYVTHLLEALEILVTGAGIQEERLLVATLLHDAIEDTDCTAEEIESRFGEEVAQLVLEVTQPKPGPGETREDTRQRYLDRVWNGSREVHLIKLADRLSSVQKLGTHPRPERQRSYYRETCEYIVPLAQKEPWFHDVFAEWQEENKHLAQPAN